MSGALQAVFQNMRSFGKGGWAIYLSGTTLPGEVKRNSIFATATNLYVGSRFSNFGNTPSAVCSVSITAPSLNWSAYYYRSGATVPSWSTGMYASGSYVYGLLSENSGEPYLVQYDLSTGSLVSQTHFSGGSNGVSPADIVEDSSSNLCFSFSNSPSTGRRTSITKVNSALTIQWGFTFENTVSYKGSYGDSDIKELFTDSSNNIYAGGTLSNASSANRTAICGVIKVDSAGTALWKRNYGNANTGAGQVGFQGAWLNGAGNVMVAFGGDAADGLYFAEVSASTGVYTGSYKQKLTFTGNVGAYKNSSTIVKADSSGNVWVFMANSATTMWLAKIDAALTTVTALSITGTASITPQGLFVDTTNVYFSASVGTSGGSSQNYFKLPVDIAPFVGSTVTTNSTTYTFAAATGTLASHTFTDGSALSNTQTAGMNSTTTAFLTSDPQTNTLTSYTF